MGRHIVYVTQFDGFWSLTPKQWREVVRTVVAGGEYNLSDYREIQRPRCVHKNHTGRGYWIDTLAHSLQQMPCDWDDQQWQDELHAIDGALL